MDTIYTYWGCIKWHVRTISTSFFVASLIHWSHRSHGTYKSTTIAINGICTNQMLNLFHKWVIGTVIAFHNFWILKLCCVFVCGATMSKLRLPYGSPLMQTIPNSRHQIRWTSHTYMMRARATEDQKKTFLKIQNSVEIHSFNSTALYLVQFVQNPNKTKQESKATAIAEYMCVQ